MIKVFKEADIKGKIATIISWSMMVLAIVNIFTKNDTIRIIIWVGIVIALTLDFLLMLELYQKVEKELFEERKRKINLVHELNILRSRIVFVGLSKAETGEEFDQIIERYLNDDM